MTKRIADTALKRQAERVKALEEELRQVVIYTRIEKAPLRDQELASIERLIGPVSPLAR